MSKSEIIKQSSYIGNRELFDEILEVTKEYDYLRRSRDDFTFRKYNGVYVTDKSGDLERIDDPEYADRIENLILEHTRFKEDELKYFKFSLIPNSIVSIVSGINKSEFKNIKK